MTSQKQIFGVVFVVIINFKFPILDYEMNKVETSL